MVFFSVFFFFVGRCLHLFIQWPWMYKNQTKLFHCSVSAQYSYFVHFKFTIYVLFHKTSPSLRWWPCVCVQIWTLLSSTAVTVAPDINCSLHLPKGRLQGHLSGIFWFVFFTCCNQILLDKMNKFIGFYSRYLRSNWMKSSAFERNHVSNRNVTICWHGFTFFMHLVMILFW